MAEEPTGRYSAIWTALVARMKDHAKPAGLLDRWQVKSEPTTEEDGERDLPSVRFYPPAWSEVARNRGLIDGQLTVTVWVAIQRKNGVVAILEAIETVMDALERSPTAVDLTLGGLLARPMDISAPEIGATELSLSARLTISCLPKLSERGNRRGT